MDSSPTAAPPDIPNFRDVGGHATIDGRRVRCGMLYRSVDLAGLDGGTMGWLADLGVRTVFDLRTAPERARRPSRGPAGAAVVVLDVLADSGQADPAAFYALMADPLRASAELAGGASERFFVTTYRDLVALPSARRAFARLYRDLATDGVRPALVHCTTGKDRTGWAVAVLLRHLGVAPGDVLADYLRSDDEIREAFGFMVDDFVAKGGAREVIEPIVGAKASYLAAAFDEVDRLHGSLGAYLHEGLGLDDGTLEALATAFLEPS
jgi:protein-tyrosine phosphatase